MVALGIGLGVPFVGRTGGGGGGGSQVPGNLTPPTITRNGLVLTCDPGDWTNSPTLTYRWLRNGTAVSGATSATWSPPASAWGALFSCEVVGTNAAGAGLPALAQAVYIGILDVITIQPAAACDWHRLKAAYTGPAGTVRNGSNDPATQDRDIGLTTTGVPDSAALLAHCGAGSGSVVTYYDQTGNNRHKTQTAAADQPRIVNAGTIEEINGKLAARFLGGTMNLSSGINATRRAVLAVVRHDTIIDFAGVWGNPTSDIGLRLEKAQPVYRSNGGDMATNGFNRLNGVQTNWYAPTATISAGVAHIIGAQNGVLQGPFLWRLGGYLTGRYMIGAVGTVVEFDTPPSLEDWQLLEGNLGARYGITVA